MLYGRMKCGLFIVFLLGFFHLDPALAADMTLVPSVRLTFEYDDNISFSRSDVRDDLILVVSPEIALSNNYERLMLNLSALGRISRYLENNELDDEYYKISLGGNYIATEKMRLGVNLSQSRDTTLDSELTETGILTTRQNRDNTGVSFKVSYALSDLSNLDLGYSFQDVNYESYGSVDYRGESIYLNYKRNLKNAKDAISFRPYYSQNESVVNTVDNLGFSAGYVHPFNETWSSSVNLGARHTTTNYYTFEDKKWGMSGNISLDKKGINWNSNFQLSRELSYSSYGVPVETDRLNVSYNNRISERLSSGISGSIYFTKSEGYYSNQDTVYYVFSPRVQYKLGSNLFFSLSYTYSNSQNRLLIDNQGVDKNVFRLSLSYSYPKKK